ADLGVGSRCPEPARVSTSAHHPLPTPRQACRYCHCRQARAPFRAGVILLKTVSEDIYAPGFVKGVFDRCSEQYIAFSWICSFGFTERWRRQCAELLPEQSGAVVCFDLMAGTGEVWPHILRRFPSIAEITAVDISSGM